MKQCVTRSGSLPDDEKGGVEASVVSVCKDSLYCPSRLVNAGAGAGGVGGSIDVGDIRALLDAAFDGRRPGRVG